MKVDVPGYEGLYTIDNQGVVVSSKTGRAIKAVTFPNGYVYVHLYKNGKGKCVRVHRIVAETFLPKPAGCDQVNHINGIKTDNRIQNLEWCNRYGNMKHAMEKGLFNPKGEANPSAKLTQEDVNAIRAEYIKGSKQHGTVALAKKYNVSNVMIGKIVRHENWAQHRAKGDV